MLPLIRLDLFINNRYNYQGVYDSGSNISLINFEFLHRNKIPFIKLYGSEFNMVSGKGEICGVVKLEIKIMNIREKVLVFVINDKKFHYGFLLGLDLIKTFRLCQNEKLEISQNILESLNSGTDFCTTNNNSNSQLVDINVNHIPRVNFNDLDHLEKDKKIAIENVINN